MLKKRLRVMFCTIAVFFLFTGFLTVFAGCSGGGDDSAKNVDPNAINANGIRNDVQQYIDTTYPNSAKKRAALTQYAKSLQDAYTKISTEAEARNFEPQIMRSLSCAFLIAGGEYDLHSPIDIVGEKTVNTPERLEAELRYEKFLDGKVFTVSSPGDTVYTVCDFNPDSLPN